MNAKRVHFDAPIRLVQQHLPHLNLAHIGKRRARAQLHLVGGIGPEEIDDVGHALDFGPADPFIPRQQADTLAKFPARGMQPGLQRRRAQCQHGRLTAISGKIRVDAQAAGGNIEDKHPSGGMTDEDQFVRPLPPCTIDHRLSEAFHQGFCVRSLAPDEMLRE